MRGIWLAAVACGLSSVLAGCGAVPGTPESGTGEQISVVWLGFDPDGWAAGGQYAALSPAPIHLGAFASWYGRGDDEFDRVPDATPLPVEPTYVAVTGGTGCRVPTDVAVSRTGADLKVEFVGGEDRPECARPVGPAAYLAVPSDALAGVRTVNGVAPLAPEGPGELLDLVPLGAIQLDPVPPVELGTPEVTAMRDTLRAANAGDPAEVATALGGQTEPGRRAFGFVLTGCAETDAVLLLDQDHVTAELVGAQDIDCDAPAHFLATFAVDAELVPESAVLAG